MVNKSLRTKAISTAKKKKKNKIIAEDKNAISQRDVINHTGIASV